MADFIHFEAEVSGNESLENENENDNDIEMNSFINDESESEDENFEFANANINIREANERIEQEALQRIHDCDDYSNLSYASDDDGSSIFEFAGSENHIKKFKQSLLPKSTDEIYNNFVNVLLFKIREITEEKTDICSQDELLKNETIKKLFEKLSCENIKFSLDLQKFNNICYEINEVLIEFGIFLRVFKQKNKYRQLLIKKNRKTKPNKATCKLFNSKVQRISSNQKLV